MVSKMRPPVVFSLPCYSFAGVSFFFLGGASLSLTRYPRTATDLMWPMRWRWVKQDSYCQAWAIPVELQMMHAANDVG